MEGTVWLLFIHIYCGCLILGLYNKLKICCPPITTQFSHNKSVIFGICDIPVYSWSDVWCVFKNSKASLEAETRQINNSYKFYDLFLNTKLYVHFWLFTARVENLLYSVSDNLHHSMRTSGCKLSYCYYCKHSTHFFTWCFSSTGN